MLILLLRGRFVNLQRARRSIVAASSLIENAVDHIAKNGPSVPAASCQWGPDDDVVGAASFRRLSVPVVA